MRATPAANYVYEREYGHRGDDGENQVFGPLINSPAKLF